MYSVKYLLNCTSKLGANTKESEIMLWDVAAGIAIVEGAGGRVLKRKGLSEYSCDVVADNAMFDLTTIGS